jgi:hypothetical protein
MTAGNGEDKALDGDIIAPPGVFKTNNAINIGGVAATAQKLPDDKWYELRLHIRKIPGGAEVKVFPKWQRID